VLARRRRRWRGNREGTTVSGTHTSTRQFARLRGRLAWAIGPLLVVIVGGWAHLHGGARPAWGGEAHQRTNVLLLCADDHAAYVTGAYGNRRVRTPHIDRLAAAGLRFDAAYCNSPVCTASRQSLLTGRYPRTLGVTRLQTALPESEVTLADVFATAGYRTAAIGKMHFNSPLKHGFELRVDQREYQAWLGQQPAAPPPGVEVQPEWRPFRDPARTWLNSACRPIGQSGPRMDASYFAEQAAEYLTRAGEQPFFLLVSFYEPHSPFRFPLEYAGRHEAREFAQAEQGGDYAWQVGSDDARQVPAVFRDLTASEKQGIAAAYYTSVEFLDASVGRVLAALHQSGHDQDTLVVYLGDHGYLLGQHGRFEKHCSYEQAVRVPLAMRLPGRIAAGGVSDALVELVDLAPTLCELTGVAVAPSMQGRSLADLVAGRTAAHRPHAVVEYAPNDEVMIRDRRWKLVYERGAQRRGDGYDTELPRQRHWLRLFDLQRDPLELASVAGDPANAATIERLQKLLVEHLVRTARQPELIPASGDPLDVLDHCVQSRDVPGPEKTAD
jgi:choline-sulfatase